MTASNEFTGALHRSNDDDSSSATIRAEIEKTRARLGETVEALGAQLNPTHLKERVKESVREATIGRVQHMASNTRDRIAETGRGLAQTIRENPLPAAMAAAGIGWLLISNRDQRPATRRFTNGEPDEFAIPDESYGESGVRARVRNVAENVADKASDLTERAQDATQRAVQRAKETGDRVVERTKEAGDRISSKADETMYRVRQTARTTARRVENQYEESPMAMGAVALAIGLAVGLSVPGTRKETELMGDARDRLVDKTRERIADTTDKVERVVQRALPEVKEVVRDAAREVRAAARDEGLSG
jgi:ElaB/YqjD/DUF883 family membrane-anchored ribosome-binding protein